ncbi:MAG: DMT family transporter [Rhodospirillales bacterium]|nr:DMT family transporter [Rhodospirillales bacterium]MCB9996046.1 DMT family transporter [Rhodospirillales bacterium]
MSRLKADALLLTAAIIWGFAFIAQKSAMEVMGPMTYAGLRFLISALVILPFALREHKAGLEFTPGNIKLLTALCLVFFAGVNVQQFGVALTSVTNAGFLTGLYVIFVPLFTLLIFKKHPHKIVWIAAPLCVFGVWLLGDASLTALGKGDLLVLACAVFFGMHVVLVGIAVQKIPCPLTLSAIQYAVCAALSLGGAVLLETITWDGIIAALPSLLYAGILSGGIAYTFQIIAQQHTPASDAAIILSGEALFAALGGVLIMNDHLNPLAWGGCGVIFTAILMVELYPIWQKRRRMS